MYTLKTQQYEKNGILSKKTFGSLLTHDCVKRAYIELGNNNHNWIAPTEKILTSHRDLEDTEDIMAFGHKYENAVYNALYQSLPHDQIQFNGSIHPDSQTITVTHSNCSNIALEDLYRNIKATPKQIVLLEHQYTIHPDFVKACFGLDKMADIPIAEHKGLKSIRPDILVVGPHPSDSPSTTRTLDSQNNIVYLSAEELQNKIGISIVDVKNTPNEKIGKGYFAEILFYVFVLHDYLQRNNLTDKFFVRLDGNGILGREDTNTIKTMNISAIFWQYIDMVSISKTLLVPLYWNHTVHLYQSFLEELRNIYDIVRSNPITPKPLQEIDVNLQGSCSACPFFTDCCKRFTGHETPNQHIASSANWTLRLLPYIRTSIAEQLEAKNIHTIQDVYNNIETLELGDIPSPLHAEKKLLHLKAKAFMENKTFVVDSTNISANIPKNRNMTLLINVEMEQPNNTVFAFGVYWTAEPPSTYHADLVEITHSWWSSWRTLLHSIQEDPFSSEQLQDAFSFLEWEQLETILEISPDTIISHLQNMYTSLLFLEQHGTFEMLETGSEWIEHPILPHVPLEQDKICYQHVYISPNNEENAEYLLFCELINHLYHIIQVSLITETLVASFHEIIKYKRDKEGNIISETDIFARRLQLAGLYWSNDQIEHIQTLADRYVTILQTDPEHLERYQAIMEWMTPINSDIPHANLSNKLFDIHKVLREAVALPHIVSYSWHGTYAVLFPDNRFQSNVRYWIPNFNFMDYTAWYEIIEKNDISPDKRVTLTESIRQELLLKLACIQRIYRRIHILLQQSNAIATENKAVPTPNFHNNIARSKPWNHVGKLWLGYHLRNQDSADRANVLHRHHWPEYSIAKLQSAKIHHLSIDPVDTVEEAKPQQSVFSFFITGVSSNMKIKSGDYIYICHLSTRDFGKHWQNKNTNKFEICSMQWSSMEENGSMLEGYLIKAINSSNVLENNNYDAWLQASEEEKEKIFPNNIFAQLNQYGNQDWYIYTQDSDNWENKLSKSLDTDALGQSWLGDLLARTHNLLPHNTPIAPTSSTLSAKELYLYAPLSLPSVPNIENTPLQTPIKWAPDPSQRQAILFALSRPISCIQGPPGTGKSQTIVALIEEFVLRNPHIPKPKILVTAFSHAAMQVVATKLQESRYGTGRDPEENRRSLVANIPLIITLPSGGDIPLMSNKTHSIPPFFFDVNAKTCNGEKINFRTKAGQYNFIERIFDMQSIDMNSPSIFLGNVHTLHKLHPQQFYAYKNGETQLFFDLIIIDEASQMPADQLNVITHFVRPFTVEVTNTAPLSSTYELSTQSQGILPVTQIVLVGDDNQLPPIQQTPIPPKLRPVLDSAFRYYLEGHNVPNIALATNYRSHDDIVECIRRLHLYNELHSHHSPDYATKNLPSKYHHLPKWLQHVLQPTRVVNTIIHTNAWDASLSELEAHITTEIIIQFYAMHSPDSPEKERKFWKEEIGVVSPHNAHGRLIIRSVFQEFQNEDRVCSQLPPEELMDVIESTIYSVEKFQGSDRSFIIGTIGVSSTDQLFAEEEFLYNMNRFNVLVSRAKHKMLLICSKNYLSYVPNARDLMPVAHSIRQYAYDICKTSTTMTVKSLGNQQLEIRWKE